MRHSYVVPKQLAPKRVFREVARNSVLGNRWLKKPKEGFFNGLIDLLMTTTPQPQDLQGRLTAHGV